MKPRETKIGTLAEEATAVIVALLAFAGEKDANATAAYTVSIIANREKMETVEALSLAEAVEEKIGGMTGQVSSPADAPPVTVLAVMPPVGQA